MRKIFLFAFISMILFSSIDVMAKRSYTKSKSSQSFRFTEDMVNRIKKSCPDVLKNADKKSENLEAFCSVKDLNFEGADLGPWQKIVARGERLFLQFRRLIYIGAVFMLLWIFVKASYEGEMKWMHIAMLVMGVIILAFAEVLLAFATNRVSLDDVINDGVYVDCRDKKTGDAYFVCSTSDSGAALYDSRYFLQVSGEMKSRSSKKYGGLY